MKPPASGPLFDRPRRKRLPLAAIVLALLVLLALVLWLLVEQPWVNAWVPSPQHENAKSAALCVSTPGSLGSTTPLLPRSWADGVVAGCWLT